MNNRTYKIMKTFKTVIAMLLVLPAWASAQKQPDLVQYANTLQGTNSNFGLSHGNTFPATAMPYGVHEWTPQTNVNGEGFKCRQLDKNFITYDDIARGGSLKFVMGAQPNKSRNTTKAASPYSLSAPVK